MAHGADPLVEIGGQQGVRRERILKEWQFFITWLKTRMDFN
jgi:hypothetical protein